MSLTHDFATTERFAAALMLGGVVLELRAFRAKYHNRYIVPADYNTTYAGWYDQPDQFAADAFRAKGVSVFTTFNRINPELRARSYNVFNRQKHTTKDDDVTAIRWWFLDIDPERPADVSATETERTAALRKRDSIIAAIPGLEGAVLTGSSGNGAYALVRIKERPNDEAGRNLGANGLKIVGRMFDDAAVKIDQKTKNPSRIMAVAGSIKCKGSDIPERPWRVVTLDAVPDVDAVFDLDGFVTAHADLLAQIEAEAKRPGRAPRATTAGAPLPDVATPQADLDSRIFRATKYLMSMEPAISGQDGQGQAFDAACALVKGFDLSPYQARPIFEAWNAKCSPRWADHEIDHKLGDADKLVDDKPRGYLFDRDAAQSSGDVAEDDASRQGWEDNPHEIGRRHVRENHSHPDGPTIRFWNGEFHIWRNGAYRPIKDKELKGRLSNTANAILDAAYYRDLREYAASQGDGKRPKPTPVTVAMIASVHQAMTGSVQIPMDIHPNAPCWLGGEAPAWKPSETLALQNALVHLPSYVAGSPCTMPPTPRYFTPSALAYDWTPDAPPPKRWLDFLAAIFPDDQESIDCLQEWMGLQLVPDTSHEKIMALIGPKRAGKGTIATIMQALVGELNYAGPQLSTFGNTSDFVLEGLIGKLSAVIDDARMSSKSDPAVIAERLLSISGQGRVSVNRKYLSPWTGVLPCRITLIANELPRMIDQSGALASRFIVLQFTQTFLGREDHTLKAELPREMPGILLWAIEGWRRLKARGRLIQPASGVELHKEMDDMSSPISTFLRDCCIVDPNAMVSKSDLFRAWRAWCEEVNEKNVGVREMFGRNLRAAVPSLQTCQPRGDGRRIESWRGVGLVDPTHAGDSVTGSGPIDFGTAPAF